MSGMTLFDDPRVAELLGGPLTTVLRSLFDLVEIAEDEIVVARGGLTEKDDTDPLWLAFPLLRATHDRMTTEFVYRAHCRELLARVRDGQDTRPATDAELALVISETSLRHPLPSELLALQMRIFARSFPEQFAMLDIDDLDGYERREGRQADEWEHRLRRRARQDWRKRPKPKPQEELF